MLSIFCRLSACSADLRGFQSPGTASFFSAAITVSFPGQATPEDQQPSPVASLPVASSDSGSLSQVRRSSQVSYPVEGFLSYLIYRFPKKIELTSFQFNLLMNLNHLLKPPIILAGEILYRKKSMPRKEKRIRLSLIACRERSHCLQVDLQDQA